MNKLFEMVNLERHYETPAGVVKALDGINIEIHEGESYSPRSLWFRKNNTSELFISSR